MSCPICKREISGPHDIDVFLKGTTISAKVPCPGAPIQETLIGAAEALRAIHGKLEGIATKLLATAERFDPKKKERP